jgi:hypothetical protein
MPRRRVVTGGCSRGCSATWSGVAHNFNARTRSNHTRILEYNRTGQRLAEQNLSKRQLVSAIRYVAVQGRPREIGLNTQWDRARSTCQLCGNNNAATTLRPGIVRVKSRRARELSLKFNPAARGQHAVCGRKRNVQQ